MLKLKEDDATRASFVLHGMFKDLDLDQDINQHGDIEVFSKK